MRLWPKHKHKWRVVRTIWPYPDGYGVYCRGCRTVVDTGLSKAEAGASAKELNAGSVVTEVPA